MLGFSRLKTISTLAFTILLVIFALPNIMPKNLPPIFDNTLFKLPKINLGLDLNGGSHLLLEVESSQYNRENLKMMRDVFRRDIKARKIKATVKLYENNINIATSDHETLDEVVGLLNKHKHILIDRLSDTEIKIYFSKEYLLETDRKLVNQSIEIIRKRIDEFGTKEPTIQKQGENRIILQVPGLENTAELKNLLGKTAKMSFFIVKDIIAAENFEQKSSGYEQIILPDKNKRFFYVLDTSEELGGANLTDANASFDKGQAVVGFKFNTQGARIFAELTKKNPDKHLAIVLDNQVISAPRIHEPILGGSGMINGDFTIESANELAVLLRAGALPAELKILEERLVGPSLGSDSIKAGKTASIIATICVIILMIMIYGIMGVFASIALIFAIIFIIAVMSITQLTLTMPGIAGIVLTIGMAVDANVLIFERMKELKNQPPYFACVQAFKNARSTIIDANVTTLMVAVILYIFGTGPVKGFAITLSIGIFATLYAGIVITKLLIAAWLRYSSPKTLGFR